MTRHATTRFKGGVLVDEVRTSPVDRHQIRFRRIALAIMAAIVIVACAVALRVAR
jgi:hypothetical protein